mmetsp:Transcript_9675/g.14914  ORF Transcript_9675/g.14914 Transcript_9675/m.14914 type:complete len:82 (-) Transcript_9675:362-607(-)
MHHTRFKYAGSFQGDIIDQILPTPMTVFENVARNCWKGTFSVSAIRCWLLQKQHIQTYVVLTFRLSVLHLETSESTISLTR